MNVARRRRGDFVRATSSVLATMAENGHLSPESGARFCEIAVATCGAWRAGLYVLSPAGQDGARVVEIARSAADYAGHGPLASRITVELLQTALTQDGSTTVDDLLVEVVTATPRQAGGSMQVDPATQFLVMQLVPASAEAESRAQIFTAVDQQRLHVLSTLAALKQEAVRSAVGGDLLARMTSSLTHEPTVDGKLRQIAAFLAETTRSERAWVWTKLHMQGKDMRLRAVFAPGLARNPLPEDQQPIGQAMQTDLARLAHMAEPTAVAVTALPWLSEILSMSSDAQAIVTPIHRGKEVVGVAICSSPQGLTQELATSAALERRALLQALADQIALTTEYQRSSLSAQQNARRYALLATIGEISLAKIGMDEMLDAILPRVQDYFAAATITLQLLDSERSALRTRSLHRQDSLVTRQSCELRAALVSNGQTKGTLLLRRTASEPFDDVDEETLSLVAEQIALALATSGRYQIQASLAVLDALTDLPNRRAADNTLDREFARAQRQGSMINVALLDIDNFKRINDAYGHDMGDSVLREVARVFKTQLRATDYVARYGGEEFLILLPGTESLTARRICERLRHAVSLIIVRDGNGQPISVTASLGGAAYPEDSTSCGTILRQADAALYQAKESGRNRLCWANDRR